MANQYTNPKRIKELLDGYVMGQEKGTKAIAMAIAQHIRRIETKDYYPENIKSDNVLLIGPTGCGKTETVRVLQRIQEEIECPVLMFNILDYSATKTWQGDSITSIFNKIVEEACYINHHKYGKSAKLCIQEDRITSIANNAIIFLDEFDKIAINGEGKSRQFLKEYQSNLLKIIEGNIYEIPVPIEIENEDYPNGEPPITTITIDSANMMFVLLGAFDGIEYITLNRLEFEQKRKQQRKATSTGFYQDTKIGFMVNQQPTEPESVEYAYEQLIPTQEDIIQYGFMRELMGRINIRTLYKPLSTDNLVEILLHSKTSAYREYQLRFRQNNFELKCDRDALREIARISVERGTGARGLRTVFDELCRETLYDLAGDPRPIRCLLRGKEIRAHKLPLLHDRTNIKKAQQKILSERILKKLIQKYEE